MSEPGRPGGAIATAALLAALAAAAVPARSRALEPTTGTHTGPWYQPGEAHSRNLWNPGDPGQPLHLRGIVLDVDARPVADALVEFWHTDPGGGYPPLRGAVRAGADGGFGLRTVLPGHNQGYRARHIHFVVSHETHRRLVTRIYFRGDPNIGEAPWPELAILLEEGRVDDTSALFGNVQFVLGRP